jgi:L-threonylcarbamoyladenylate synthase
MKLVSVSDAIIEDAARLLRDGELVAFPTETVYGLGAHARDDHAVARVFAAKGRPSFNPLIVHVSDLHHAEQLAEFTAAAHDLAASFWPGPLTLVLRHRKENGISALASAGLSTIALRVPSHPIARRLLEVSGIPIAAPSANKSGRLSPTTPAHVASEFGDEVAMILAGGRSQVGLESTVIDMTGNEPLLLRSGGITREEIEAVIGTLGDANALETIRAPGMLAKHYAPAQSLRMNATILNEGEAYLGFGPDSFTGHNAAMQLNLSEAGDLTEAAANLFAMLHELDRPDHAGIAVAPIPESGLGVAINDRLRRASLR